MHEMFTGSDKNNVIGSVNAKVGDQVTEEGAKNMPSVKDEISGAGGFAPSSAELVA